MNEPLSAFGPTHNGQVTAATASVSAASPLVIEASHVGKVYESRTGSVAAVQEIDLKVREGEFISLVGPSGCGKSTFLMVLSGLVRPTTGTVAIFGAPVSGPVNKLGMVFQKDLLLAWRTVLDNVLLQVKVRGLKERDYRQRAEELLEVVGLGDFKHSYPHELSGGMRQRAAIARALVHNPPLVLMDEPFASVDAITRDQLNLELQGLVAWGGYTVILVTHSITEAVLLSDRIVVCTPRPAQVAAVLEINLPRPRSLDVMDRSEMRAKVREIRSLLEEMGVLKK